MKLYKANFHTHTKASFDGYNSYKAIYNNCKKAGINLIAITDHDTIIGAQEFIKWLAKHNKTDLTVILGEEITCNDGTHIIGFFLKNFIDKDTPLNVIKQIKAQDGLVYFPHPARKDGIMKSKFYKKAITLGDAFEVFNAKINNDYNLEAQKEFKKYTHLVPLGGSDAHYNADILKCICHILLDPSDLKNSIVNSKNNNISIYGVKKISGDNNYFSSYYKIKTQLNLPQFLRNLGKFIFPMFKNFKEKKSIFVLENIFINDSKKYSK